MPHLHSIIPAATHRLPFLALLLGASLLPSPSPAASSAWINASTNSTWGTQANWSNATPAQGPDAIADFSTVDLTATRTVNLGAPWTIGGLRFGDLTPSNNWTLANGTGGPWTLTLENSAVTPTIEIVNQITVISATLGGSAGFQKTGTGTLTLTGANSLTGGIQLNQGTLAFATGALGTNAVTFTGNSTLTWNGTSTQDVSSQLGVNDGVVATLNVGANNVTLASAIQGSGTGAITKSGAGTLTLTAAQSLTGTTRVVAGRLILAGGDQRLAGGAVSLGQGAGAGILQLGDATAPSNQTVSSLAIGGTATTSAIVGGNAALSTLTVNAATVASFSGTLGGADPNANNLALTKTGAAALTLGGANTFVGNVNLTGGALIVTNAAALGAGTKTVTISGSTNAPSLQLNQAAGLTLGADISFVTSNDNTTAPAILNTAGANTIAGNIALASGGFGGSQTRIAASGGSLTLSGNIAPDPAAATARTLILDGAAAGTASGTLSDSPGLPLAVTKGGAGSWTLSGANSYSGTTVVNNGRLIVGSILGNGTPQPLGTATTGITLGSATPATLEYTGTTDTTLSRAITVGGVGGGVIENSGGALLTLGGNLTKNARPLTLSGGSFRVTGRIAGTGTTGDLLISGATVTLANATNNYTGPTVIGPGGTLTLTGGLSATASVNLSGGTLMLGANDAIHNAADVKFSGGTFTTGGFREGTASAPGLGLLILEADTQLDFGTGTGSLLSFAGFSFTGGTLAITQWSGAPGTVGSADEDRLIIAGSAEAFGAAFPQSAVSFNGVPGYAAIAFDSERFEIVAIPEPSSTALAGAAALLGLIGYRERRRVSAQALSLRPRARPAPEA